jgi:hypothetical protein
MYYKVSAYVLSCIIRHLRMYHHVLKGIYICILMYSYVLTNVKPLDGIHNAPAAPGRPRL